MIVDSTFTAMQKLELPSNLFRAKGRHTDIGSKRSSPYEPFQKPVKRPAHEMVGDEGLEPPTLSV